jgi:hypothetical protein
MLATLFNICLLRANPQDLPASPTWLGLAIGAYFLTGLIGTLAGLDWANALKVAVVSTVLLVAVMHTALLLRNLKPRVTQTLTALAGSGALMRLIAGAALALLHDVVPVLLLSLPFEIWAIVVYGHVLRHAFSISLPLGIGFAFLYMLFSSLVVLSFLSLEGPSLPRA